MKIAEARQWVKDNGMSVTKTTSMDEIVDYIIDNALQEDAIAEGFDESLFEDNDTSSTTSGSLFDNIFGIKATKRDWQILSIQEFEKLPAAERQFTMTTEQISKSAETYEIKSVSKPLKVNGQDRWKILTTLGETFWLDELPPSSGVVGITKIKAGTWFPNWINGKMEGARRCNNQDYYKLSRDEFKLTYSDRIKIQAKAQALSVDATAE
jgi:hypothetical protein